MKTLIVSAAVAAAILGAGAATAQQQSYSVDTPIAELMSDEQAAAIVSQHFPNLAAHPMYESFKSMSLEQLADMSNGQMTQAQLDAAAADLAEISQ